MQKSHSKYYIWNLINFINSMAKDKKVEQEEPLEKKLWKAADKLRKNIDAARLPEILSLANGPRTPSARHPWITSAQS